MCTRLLFNGNDMITGFNFDIDLNDWDHKVFWDNERFYIGIKQPDDVYHSYHGVNINGNVGTLLYVHGNEEGMCSGSEGSLTIAELTERFIKNQISFEDAVELVRIKRITYAPDATMQAMLSDKRGNVLIVEPGIGFRKEYERFSLITNYSIIKPELTREFINPGDTRYERAKKMLCSFNSDFTVSDAFSVLEAVIEKGIWATRVSFVYSSNQEKVYYTLNGDFNKIYEHRFSIL